VANRIEPISHPRDDQTNDSPDRSDARSSRHADDVEHADPRRHRDGRANPREPVDNSALTTSTRQARLIDDTACPLSCGLPVVGFYTRQGIAMHISRNAKPFIVIALVGALLGVSSFATAAFVQDSSTGDVSGSAEAMLAAVVTGAQTGTLLPGETAYVTLTLSNPNTNVKIKLLSITPGDVVIDTTADVADKSYCQGQLELSTAGADPLLPTLAVSEADFPYKLTDAVKLKDDTDIRCQGMTFHTTWTAQFEAVR
jgi:hypothetical protein